VAYLQLIAGPRPGGELIEIRYATPHGLMRRLFIPARAPDRGARAIGVLAPRNNVYVGVALRSRRAGTRTPCPAHIWPFWRSTLPTRGSACSASLYPPSILIASGSAGHLHAYWALRTPVPSAAIEAANRRLAQHLGGDLASVDAARILRPPGSLNHKHSPPRAVGLLELAPGRSYELQELVGELPAAASKPPAACGARARVVRHPLDRALLAVRARDYVWMLAGLEPSRTGKVCCPFHEDRIASLQLYEDGSFYCFVCRAGGSIYDFAAALWLSGQSRDEPLRGERFIEVRDRLSGIFLGERSTSV